MAPRLPRRPRAEGEDPDDTVRLDDDAHAWWARRTAEGLLGARPEPLPERPPRDVLAEHLGPDWAERFGLTALGAADPGPSPAVDRASATEQAEAPPAGGAEPAADPSDPLRAYAVLGVDPSASWEEIVAAHRAMARRHHPDRVAAEGPEAVAAAEERIRAVNAAFAELRIRRGR